MPRRWPTVTSSTASTGPRSSPVSWSTSRPGWSGSRSPRKPPRPSSERMKQTSWLSGLAAVRRPSRAASSRTSRLGQLADREERAGQLVLAEHGQHVGLVLRRVRAPAQPEAPGSPSRTRRAWWPVATASKPSVAAAIEQPVELEMPVALDARVGRPPVGVAAHVGVDHVPLELGREVEDVVDDPELVGNPAGVLDVGDRAAPRVGRPAPQLEGGADHAGRARSRSATRAAATEESTPPDMATSTRIGLSLAAGRPRRARRSRARSMSASVVVDPSENRTPLAASVRDRAPWPSSTWLASTAPLEQAAPAETATPASSSRIDQRLALDAGEAEVQ